MLKILKGQFYITDVTIPTLYEPEPKFLNV
jgi:hypothetical protein